LTLVSAIAALPASASACQVIGLAGGGGGVAATPLCAGEASGPSEAEREQWHYENLQQAFRTMRAQRAEKQRVAEYQKSPEYQAYLNGHWVHFEPKTINKGKGAARLCGAMFVMDGKTMALYGSTDPNEVATLTFADLGVQLTTLPLSYVPHLTSVTLTQNGAAPVTTQAYSHNVDSSVSVLKKAGAITFAVPSLKAGVDGLLDTSDMSIEVDGHTFGMHYHSGKEAQAKLRECMKG